MPSAVTLIRSDALSDVAQYAYAATAASGSRLVYPLDGARERTLSTSAWKRTRSKPCMNAAFSRSHSERTKAGLAAAKARGRLGGRPRTMTPAKTEAARQLRSQGKALKETAQILSVSVSSLTRALSRNDVLEVADAAA